MKLLKSVFCIIASLCVVLICIPDRGADVLAVSDDAEVSATSENVIASGTFHSDGYVTWVLTDAGTLTISGTGQIEGNYLNPSASTLAPWLAYADSIKHLIFENGMTFTGGGGFRGCTALETVTLPDSITAIGSNSFV